MSRNDIPRPFESDDAPVFHPDYTVDQGRVVLEGELLIGTAIERVARALALRRHRWEGLSEDGRETYRGDARAAFKAMRQPSAAMVRAFVDLALHGDVLSHGGWPGYARDQWAAMIDAALSEGPMAETAPVIAGIHVHSHAEARLLSEMLARELRGRAGSDDEVQISKWFNEVNSIRVRATRERWTGWSDK